MWYELATGDYRRCIEVCDRGLVLADQLASAPVQYGSIKAMALVELGRFDNAIAEVTDDHLRPGEAQLARLTYLDRLGALPNGRMRCRHLSLGGRAFPSGCGQW